MAVDVTGCKAGGSLTPNQGNLIAMCDKFGNLQSITYSNQQTNLTGLYSKYDTHFDRSDFHVLTSGQ